MSDIDEIQKRAKEFLEKRRYERFRAGLVVRFRVISPGEKNTLLKSGAYAKPGAFMAKAAETQDLNLVVSEDISAGGLKIPTPQALIQGSELWVNLTLSGVPIPVNALATVMWSRVQGGGAFSSGLKFSGINEADLAKVEGFLTLQKKQD